MEEDYKYIVEQAIYCDSYSYLSMSAQMGPTYATWHLLIGPYQQPLHETETHDAILLVHTYTCQQDRDDMAASQTITSSNACHVAAYYKATSPFQAQQLDTWPDLIGPHYKPHQHYCYLTVCV
jgi:hypothetical protein